MNLQRATRLQGYISAEEFMNIPELSINPLAHRLERIFESVNFRVDPDHTCGQSSSVTYSQ